MQTADQESSLLSQSAKRRSNECLYVDLLNAWQP